MLKYKTPIRLAMQSLKQTQIGMYTTRYYAMKPYIKDNKTEKQQQVWNAQLDQNQQKLQDDLIKTWQASNARRYYSSQQPTSETKKENIEKKLESDSEGSWSQHELITSVTNKNDELKKIIRHSNKQINTKYHKLNTYAIYSKFHYPNQFSNSKTLGEKQINQVAKNTYWEDVPKEPIRFDREAIVARVQNAENALRKSEAYQQFKKHAFETKKEHRFRILTTIKDKLLKFGRTYGALGIILHFSIYFGNIALFYMGLESMPIEWREWVLGTLESSFHVNPEKFNSKGSNFALAWIMTKFTEPIRLLLTVSLVRRLLPFYNRRIAWIVKKFKFWRASK